MIKFDFLHHFQLTESQVVSVCELKSEHWHHDIESQKRWIKENFSSKDLHLLLFEDDKLIGYLSLVHLPLENVHGYNNKILGLGSVCVSIEQKGKNFGRLLMYLVNFYIQSNRALGILLCKKELVPFYEKSGWIVFDGTVTIKSESYDYYLMTTKALEVNDIDLPISF